MVEMYGDILRVRVRVRGKLGGMMMRFGEVMCMYVVYMYLAGE